jgi:hypothetical protein
MVGRGLGFVHGVLFEEGAGIDLKARLVIAGLAQRLARRPALCCARLGLVLVDVGCLGVCVDVKARLGSWFLQRDVSGVVVRVGSPDPAHGSWSVVLFELTGMGCLGGVVLLFVELSGVVCERAAASGHRHRRS